jgi:hypothetical protein
MKHIGNITISFNRNTNAKYIKFTPFEVTSKIDCEFNCDATNVIDDATKIVAKWFSEVNQVEERDAFVSPLKFEIVEQKHFADNKDKLKFVDIKAYTE